MPQNMSNITPTNTGEEFEPPTMNNTQTNMSNDSITPNYEPENYGQYGGYRTKIRKSRQKRPTQSGRKRVTRRSH
jgi:hypothetical protein